jgi:cell division inhibitor SepF
VNIVVVEPRTFEDSLEIVNHLKERKSIIVNLQHLDRDVSQRVIDFVSGATLALDGTQERVGHGVFIFASMNCQVQTEAEGLRNYKDLFSKSFG